MQEFLQKISSYDIFNSLLPGVIFAFATEVFTNIPMIQEDLLVGLFLYYFLGLVISRFGSLIVENRLRKYGFLKFADYKDYVRAARQDDTLPILSEKNNTYRTLCALFIFIPGVIVYDWVANKWATFALVAPYVLVLLVFSLFLFSYRKQTSYISSRVNVYIDSDNNANADREGRQ